MPSSELYSHSERLLEDHLISVANLSELFCQDKLFPEQELLRKLSKIISLSHDLGKATNFFQDYLISDEKNKLKFKNKPETHHGLFSAICAYYIVKESFNKPENNFDYYPLFAFEVVKRHHGNLKDLRDEVIFDENDTKLSYKQLESIDENKFYLLSQYLFDAGLPIKLTKKIISDWIQNFSNELRNYKKILRKSNGNISNYLFLNLLYSILIDSDKSDVVIRKSPYFERQKDIFLADIVETYKSKQSYEDSSINKIRESAYNDVINKEIDIEKKVYSINLPTGLGKTLISFAFALKLRKLINNKSEGKIIPRIIYSLPFLSIIEQNSDIFEKVLSTNDIILYNNILLKHHHLSDNSYKINENEELESDGAKIMIEGWNSEIIVTTFVQLFHTLVTNKNKALRKFHRLNNSIIILDEIQSIPIKYWLLMKNIFQFLTEKLNVYIVFVTATEPLIFENKDIVSLVERDKYFGKMNRVLIKPSFDTDITLNELYDNFKIDPNKRYLFIFNTINSAKKYYELLSVEYKKIAFLSTHVTPKERLERINNIKKYNIAITTQLVEAGVDIDFDVVVRDIAPLDSINQASGRCNRHNKIDKGEVYVFSLKDENNRKYSSYVYDSVLLEITRKILNKYQNIEETKFLELIDEYYKETSTKKSMDNSKKILEATGKLRYDSDELDNISISNFKLIDNEHNKKDVFIEIDEEAKDIWNKYIEIGKIKVLFERKKAYDKLKSNFYKYVISIPINTTNCPPDVNFIGYINNNIISDYYDSVTGFITKDNRLTFMT